jgi:hypothetical protein
LHLAVCLFVSRSGEKIALVGHFDKSNLEEMGVYSKVIGYHEGIAAPLRAELARLQPAQIAVNYSERDVAADGLSLGMYKLLQSIWGNTVCGAAGFGGRGDFRPARPEKRRRVGPHPPGGGDDRGTIRFGGAVCQTGDDTAADRRLCAGEIAKRGLDYSWPKAHNPIVTCGPHSPIGHAAPGNVVLEKGHLLHMDLGVRQNGYSSDMQRMWYVLDDGETAPPPDVQHAFDVVSGAVKVGGEHLRPGTPGWQVDEVAREFIVDHGYPEYMHAFGHMLGRVAHDGATVLGPRWERYDGVSDLEVEAGNTFAIELHVVVPDRGMMSLEENVLVTEEGVEYISRRSG